MTTPYEILIRFDDDGKYKGGHTVRRDQDTGRLSDALPLGADKEFAYPEVLAELNLEAVAEVENLKRVRDGLALDKATLESGRAALENQKAAAEQAKAQAQAAKQAAEDARAVLAIEKTAAEQARVAEEQSKVRLITAAKDAGVSEEAFAILIAVEEKPLKDRKKAQIQEMIDKLAAEKAAL